jgi:hypothetical protein
MSIKEDTRGLNLSAADAAVKLRAAGHFLPSPIKIGPNWRAAVHLLLGDAVTRAVHIQQTFVHRSVVDLREVGALVVGSGRRELSWRGPVLIRRW